MNKKRIGEVVVVETEFLVKSMESGRVLYREELSLQAVVAIEEYAALRGWSVGRALKELLCSMGGEL